MTGVGHGALAWYHGLTGGLIMMQALTIMINYDGGGDEKGAEVRFVPPVTAGGSVKFLPVV